MYPGNWNKKQFENRDQQYGNRDQQYVNRDQQYRSRDHNRNQRYQGGNQDHENKNQRYGNRDQRYGNKDQQHGNRDQQYGNKYQQYGNRGRRYQGEGRNRDQKYPSSGRDQSWSRDQEYMDQWNERNDQKEWKFEDDWSSDQQQEDGRTSKGSQLIEKESSWDDDSDKILSYNITLKPNTITSTVSDSTKKMSPKSSIASGTKLLFGKSQTHPTRVFSLKKGRGAGVGSAPGVGQDHSSGDLVAKGRGRGRGTRPIINVAPTTTDVGTVISTNTEATPTRTAVEETTTAESDSETVSSTQEVNDEQFEDADNDDVSVELKKEMVKPKRYSSQRQKPTDGETDNKQNENTLPAASG